MSNTTPALTQIEQNTIDYFFKLCVEHLIHARTKHPFFASRPCDDSYYCYEKRFFIFNAEAHKKATAPEIWEDTDGQVDVFVAGVGTGGTITGIGEYLKKKNPNVKIVAVEPASSPLLSQGKSGAHGLQGIGANFVPSVLNRAVIDEILTVTEEEAYTAGRLLAAKEGIFCGISSGAALYAATTLARRPEYANATIVCLLPDTGDRYLSTPYCDVK